MKLAKFIRKHRLKANISQSDLGHALGIHGQQISNIERGAVGLPIKHFKHISRALGLTTELKAHLILLLLDMAEVKKLDS